MTKGCLCTLSATEFVGCSTFVFIFCKPFKWNPEKWTPDVYSIISSTGLEPMRGTSYTAQWNTGIQMYIMNDVNANYHFKLGFIVFSLWTYNWSRQLHVLYAYPHFATLILQAEDIAYDIKHRY